jgi:hypothetical protein
MKTRKPKPDANQNARVMMKNTPLRKLKRHRIIVIVMGADTRAEAERAVLVSFSCRKPDGLSFTVA